MQRLKLSFVDLATDLKFKLFVSWTLVSLSLSLGCCAMTHFVSLPLFELLAMRRRMIQIQHYPWRVSL